MRANPKTLIDKKKRETASKLLNQVEVHEQRPETGEEYSNDFHTPSSLEVSASKLRIETAETEVCASPIDASNKPDKSFVYEVEAQIQFIERGIFLRNKDAQNKKQHIRNQLLKAVHKPIEYQYEFEDFNSFGREEGRQMPIVFEVKNEAEEESPPIFKPRNDKSGNCKNEHFWEFNFGEKEQRIEASEYQESSNLSYSHSKTGFEDTEKPTKTNTQHKSETKTQKNKELLTQVERMVRTKREQQETRMLSSEDDSYFGSSDKKEYKEEISEEDSESLSSDDSESDWESSDISKEESENKPYESSEEEIANNEHGDSERYSKEKFKEDSDWESSENQSNEFSKDDYSRDSGTKIFEVQDTEKNIAKTTVKIIPKDIAIRMPWYTDFEQKIDEKYKIIKNINQDCHLIDTDHREPKDENSPAKKRTKKSRRGRKVNPKNTQQSVKKHKKTTESIKTVNTHTRETENDFVISKSISDAEMSENELLIQESHSLEPLPPEREESHSSKSPLYLDTPIIFNKRLKQWIENIERRKREVKAKRSISPRATIPKKRSKVLPGRSLKNRFVRFNGRTRRARTSYN